MTIDSNPNPSANQALLEDAIRHSITAALHDQFLAVEGMYDLNKLIHRIATDEGKVLKMILEMSNLIASLGNVAQTQEHQPDISSEKTSTSISSDVDSVQEQAQALQEQTQGQQNTLEQATSDVPQASDENHLQHPWIYQNSKQ